MENAADALKIAFGVFVFVTAMALLFMMVSKAKTTSDVVLYYADNTNFYDYADSSATNRPVNVSDIVATLYRYYNESVAVTVKISDTETYIFDLGYENEILIKDQNDKELTKLNTRDDIEKNLGMFITENLNDKYDENTKFIEEFTEVATSGIYSTGNDGSEITLSAGGKKIYITYTLI